MKDIVQNLVVHLVKQMVVDAIRRMQNLQGESELEFLNRVRMVY